MGKEEANQIWDNFLEKQLKNWDYCDIRNIKPFKDNEFKKLNKGDVFILNLLHKYKRKNKKSLFLDAGCGFGFYTIYAEKLGYKSIGLDISKKYINFAKKLARLNKSKAKFLVGDVRKLPFNKEKFNIILSLGVIEHFEKTEKVVKEHSRVLKKGGLFIIDAPYKFSIFVLNKFFQKLIGTWEVGYEKSFSVSKIKKILNKYNLSTEEVIRIPIKSGTRFPLYGKILNFIEKPFFWAGFGGMHMCILARKVRE